MGCRTFSSDCYEGIHGVAVSAASDSIYVNAPLTNDGGRPLILDSPLIPNSCAAGSELLAHRRQSGTWANRKGPQRVDLSMLLISKGSQEVSHREDTNDCAIGSYRKMPNALLLHEAHRLG
jgi:hypothetical protein